MGLLDALLGGGNYSGLLGAYGDMAANPYAPVTPDTFAQRFQPAADNPLANAIAPNAVPMPKPHPAAADAPPPLSIAPDRYVNVGDYRMPQFGAPPQSAALPPSVANANAQAPAPLAMSGPPQQQPQQPAAMPPALQEGNGIGDRITAATANMSASRGLIPGLVNGITGLATGARMDPMGIQQANMRATYQSLVASGIPPQKALAATLNPEVMKTVTEQAFGQKAPETTEVENSDGTKSRFYWNSNGQQWVQMQPGKGVPGADEGGDRTGAPQPSAPPGVNAPAFYKATAENSAAEAKDLQARGEGARDALKVLTRLRDRVNAADPSAFGPISGSEIGQTLNSVGGIINPNDANRASQQSELNGLYTDAGTGMLKSRFGSRITNMDVHQGMKIVGGLSQPSRETALKTIQNNIAEAYDTLGEGIKRGVIDPHAVLQAPKSAAEAQALGPGALYIAPDGSVRRNPQ